MKSKCKIELFYLLFISWGTDTDPNYYGVIPPMLITPASPGMHFLQDHIGLKAKIKFSIFGTRFQKFRIMVYKKFNMTSESVSTDDQVNINHQDRHA